MVFENGVKNIQAAAYNGARTVPSMCQQITMIGHNPGHSTTSMTIVLRRDWYKKNYIRERGSYIESEDGFLTMPLSLTKWVLLQQSGAEGGSYGHKHTQYFCKGQRTAKDHSREKGQFMDSAVKQRAEERVTIQKIINFAF